MPSQAQAMWDAFMQRLAEVDPVGPRDSKTNQKKPVLHHSFIGSTKSYEKIFLEANEPKDSP